MSTNDTSGYLTDFIIENLVFFVFAQSKGYMSILIKDILKKHIYLVNFT